MELGRVLQELLGPVKRGRRPRAAKYGSRLLGPPIPGSRPWNAASMVGNAGELLNETEPLRLDAERNRLPVIYPTRSFMDVGGLMSYSTNIEEVNWRIATYIDKILKDAKLADPPLSSPRNTT